MRSQNCIVLIYDGSSKCSNCSNLITSEPFRKMVTRLNDSKFKKNEEDKLSKNKSLNHTNSEKNTKLRSYGKIVILQRKKIYNLSLQLARSKSARSKLHDKIISLAQRGDVSAICYNLNQAFQRGCLSGKGRLLKFIRNITENMGRKSKDHRYSETTKKFYDAIKIVGGARAARLL